MKLVFNGWYIGMKPLFFTKYIMGVLAISLSEAHNISVHIRNGKRIIVDVTNVDLPNNIIEKLLELGVVSSIEYD